MDHIAHKKISSKQLKYSVLLPLKWGRFDIFCNIVKTKLVLIIIYAKNG